MAYAAIVIADAFRKVIGIRTGRTFVKTATLNANFPNRPIFGFYEPDTRRMAFNKSSSRSPASSRPTDSLISPSVIPTARRASGAYAPCDITAGTSIKDSTAPRLTASWNNSVDSTKRHGHPAHHFRSQSSPSRQNLHDIALWRQHAPGRQQAQGNRLS